MSSSRKFEVLVSETFLKEFKSLNEKTRSVIKKHLKELENNSFEKRAKTDIKKLKGFKNPEFYRLRVGKFRIIYVIDGRKVKVTDIITRGKGYKWLD